MRFIPVTCAEQDEMLARAGVGSIDGLFEDIPEGARLTRPLDLPGAVGEIELAAHIEELAAANEDGGRLVSFLGAGCYDHHIPAIVDSVVSKPAFFTAYTPYQPEVSQGTLQAIYEYQSMICQLTGMEVSNASMYDGATALAEAALMAARVTKRRRVVVSATIHPEWRQTLATYVESGTLEVVEVAANGGVSDGMAISEALDETTAALLVASPSFYGTLEDLRSLEEAAHEVGALFVVATDPVAPRRARATGIVWRRYRGG